MRFTGMFYKVVPQFVSVQLVPISPISLWFLLVIYRTSIHGLINPFITGGGHHLVGFIQVSFVGKFQGFLDLI